jgi:hypothetical protein
MLVEELTENFIIPAARQRGITNPDITYSLSVSEGGQEAHLEVDCHKLVEAGVVQENVLSAADEISMALVRHITSDEMSVENGILSCTVR